MLNRSMSARAAGLTALTVLMLSSAHAQLVVTAVPSGYTTSSLELGLPFGGALAFDLADPDRLFASYGSFGSMSILQADVATQTTRTVAGPFGNVGGLAVLDNGDLAISENFTSDTIFRARDLNGDGDFLDPGEVTNLITPILGDNGDYTGGQLAVAPAGNSSSIPAGALLVQTADGQTSSELLVITVPDTAAPAYQPGSGAYYSGFQYNGGFGFSASGHLILGESRVENFTFLPSGRILALVNLNGDEDIDPGESFELAGPGALNAGLSDLAVSGDDRVFFTENSGDVRSFPLPADLLSETANPSVFAQTNGAYLSTVRFDRTGPSFSPGNPVRLYVGGYLPGFVQATNLVVITPAAVSAAQDWGIYE